MREDWVAIQGTAGAYEVSNLGRVRSLDREVGHRWGGIATKKGKVLKPRLDKDGYCFVALSAGGVQVQCKVHRLVAEHFLPPSDLPEVNHKDLDKENNSVANLEWSDRKGNQLHARIAGRFSALENPRRAKKLSRDVVMAIRADRDAGMTFAAIGVKHGVSAPTALKVTRGDIW